MKCPYRIRTYIIDSPGYIEVDGHWTKAKEKHVQVFETCDGKSCPYFYENGMREPHCKKVDKETE
jgi:hypothetical protein